MTVFEIDRQTYCHFLQRYRNDPEKSAQRLGQAFYDKYELNKIKDAESQRKFSILYEKDGQEARKLIAKLFLIR